MYRYLYGLLLFVVLFFPSGFAEAEVTTLTDEMSRQNLSEILLYLPSTYAANPHALQDIDLMGESLRPASEESILRGEGPFVLAADLSNHGQNQRWVFSSFVAGRSSVRLYLFNLTREDYTQEHALIASESAWLRSYPAVGFHAPFYLEPGHSYRLVLVFEENSIPPLSLDELSLLPQKSFIAQSYRLNVVLILSLGIILAIALYMLFLALSLRDRTYLYFSLYCFFSALMWASSYDVTRLLVAPESTHTLLNYFATTAQAIFVLLFTRQFLRLPEVAPRLAQTLGVFVCLGIVLLGAAPVLPSVWNYFFNAGYSGATLLLMGLAILVAMRAKVATANLYLIAFSLLFLAAFFTIIDTVVISIPTMTVRLVTLAATALSVLVLALTVVSQIRILQTGIVDARYRAETDQLTGLRNRTALERDLKGFEDPHTRGQLKDMTFIFCDVDGLKEINDHEGHDRGDALLKEFSDELVSRFRNRDHIYRIGGDEFLLLLPHYTDEKAESDWISSRFEAIDRALHKKGFPAFGVSTGTASFSEVHFRSQEAIALGDQRMYAEKHRRKNRSNPEKEDTNDAPVTA